MAKKKSSTEEEPTSDSEIADGDIIRVHLTGRVNSHEGPVFQVTDEDIAREEGMVEEGEHRHYGPRLVIVGKKQVIDGVDEALVGMEVGGEKQVEIPPEKAYGKVDPRKKRTMAFREYTRKFKKRPRYGDRVDLPKSQDQGRVVGVNQGKVTIDMNHILAGREVYFTINVVEKLEGEDAKIQALIEQRLPGMPLDDLKIEKKDNILEITFPNQALFAQQFGFMQYLLVMELQREFEHFDKIRCITEFEKPEPPEESPDEKPEEPTEEDGKNSASTDEDGTEDGKDNGEADGQE